MQQAFLYGHPQSNAGHQRVGITRASQRVYTSSSLKQECFFWYEYPDHPHLHCGSLHCEVVLEHRIGPLSDETEPENVLQEHN